MILALSLLACPASPPAVEAPPEPAPVAEIAEEVVEEVVEEPQPEPPRTQGQPPGGFVDLAVRIPDLRTDVRYHTPDNFTGAPLPGYGHPCTWLLSDPAEDLARVQADLAAQGRALLVFDAYRPRRGTLAMVAWAKRTGQEELLNGYIATVSNHNRGIAVDLTLVDLETGEPLDMGTEFDVLDERAHTRNAEGQVLENRLALKAAMEAHGWRNYSKEWWHYTYQVQMRPQPRDVPCSCFEPPEGEWVAPEGWDQPGYEMPMAWEPTPCPEG